MFAKRLLQKATHHQHHYGVAHQLKSTVNNCSAITKTILNLDHSGLIIVANWIMTHRVSDPSDGRIKVVGGNSIEGLLIAPKQLPYKNLEFLQNEGYLVGILNDNDIQVWKLETRCITCSLQWESNITAFSVISGSLFMLVGDEHGAMSVLKYAAEDGKLVDMPYHLNPDCLIALEDTFRTGHKTIICHSLLIKLLLEFFLNLALWATGKLLIAYQYGLIILWDVSEAKVVVIKGDKDLHVKDNVRDSPSKLDDDPCENVLEHMNEKEISALCWASSFGSMIAVGYVDGDILLWNIGGDAFSKGKHTGVSGKDVVKLQLSSSEKRLPVIVIHWGSLSQNSCEGQLFVYGGSEIGSEEVITVVSLQWSPGMEMLKNVRRVDFSLAGSFADMILLSSLRTGGKSHFDGLFVLTNPGQLRFYSTEILSALVSSQERKSSLSGIEPPVVVPTINPQMTAAKLSLLPSGVTFSMRLSEMTSVGPTLDPAEMAKWPLSGGTHGEISSDEGEQQKSIYIAGYTDGSVRIWDATNPTLSLLLVLEGQVHQHGSDASVTKLDFCAFTMSLAAGTESGAVLIYNLNNDAECRKLHLIKHSEHEVRDVLPSRGPQCKAVVSMVNSPVRSLQFSASGAELAMGFESGHVAVFHMMSFAVLFVTDSIPSSNYPVISVILKKFSDIDGLIKGSKHSGPNYTEQPMEELMFILTQDSKLNIIDSRTGTPISSRPLHLKKELTAISINFMSASSSKQHEQANKDTTILHESTQDGSAKVGDIKGDEHPSVEGGSLLDSLILVCGENKLRLYDMKSAIQGEDKPSYKVKLGTTCCWTSLLIKDGKVCGIIVCYNSGVLEVRSFPDLKLVTGSSLTSILRWNFRPKMEKLMTSLENGLISLVNGSELAFVCLSSGENETRFLASLPLLHDRVVAAAADAAICYSEKQKKQVPVVGVLSGIVKGFKKEKSNNAKNASPEYSFSQLEEIFSRPVTSGLSGNAENKEEEEELLDIDDIEIDEQPVLIASSSSRQGNLVEHGSWNEQFVLYSGLVIVHCVIISLGIAAKGKQSEKQKDRLFQGTSVDIKPRTRTREEILAAYRGPEYAAAAAENARNKLLERQEKLERISKRTEDLRSEAEDFASMANELVKTMEGRKWWKI
ncbi:hypothetical protein Cgig2_009837 [Carnegiea gigantea]|uniref:V-SNARE coiled-coil homology domain-containing protein n=1 Tax=Carnegiea gigantea TaxID=171969 RepID=A0A9Q1KN96_9CARY|nr:hypothetical protein Cgig2_009837 [Carnegiea gigantea]